MNILVANLYKRFQSNSNPRITDNTFSLIGHFDYLQFKVVDFQKLSKQFSDRSIQKEIHPAWSGFNSQSLYLLDLADNIGSAINDFISVHNEQLPFCVMATIEDSEQFNVRIPFVQEEIVDKLRAYKTKYMRDFDLYMEKQPKESRLSAKMSVFFTLSCIDTVLLFRTNSFSLVHDYIFNRAMNDAHLMSYTIYGISAGYDLYAHKEAIEPEENLRLSMRVSFNPNINIDRLNEIDDLMNRLTSSRSVSSIPAGRYHRLYYITQGVYNVLNACLNTRGQLFLSNSDNSHSKYVSGYRFTLSFKDSIKKCSPLPDDSVHTSADGICEHTKSVYKSIKALNDQWKANAKNMPYIDKLLLSDLNNYAITVENTIREYMYFFAFMDNHVKHQINLELSASVIDPLKKLYHLITDFKTIMNAMWKDESEIVVPMYSLFLSQIQSVISKLGNQVRDLMHMQQDRLEDRGIFRNDVSATAKLCLGYYSYAKLLSDALFDTDKDSITHSKKNPFAFYINLDTMNDRVTATEHFGMLLDYQHQKCEPTKAAVVGIDISRQCVGDIFYVKSAITHEIAHFVGWRNRPFRAKCMIRSIAIMLSLFLIPDIHCKSDAKEPISQMFNDERKKFAELTESIRKQFVESIDKSIWDAFNECLDNNLNWAIQKNCEDIIIIILQSWLGNPTANNTLKDVTGIPYVDIPSMVVNLNAELHQKWGQVAFDWLETKNMELNSAIDFLYDYLAGPVYLLNDRIYDTKNRIDDLINGDVFSPNSFCNVRYDEKSEKISLRTSVDSWYEMRVSQEKKSLSSYVRTICNTYSEVYCDLIMVKLLHLSADQYIDFVFRENRLTNDACWRIWSVLQFAYDSTSISDKAKVKKAQIEYNAGSYLHCDDAMQAYLQSIWSAPDMNDLLTRAPGYFIPSDGENTSLASVIHLYACYLLLQEERG